MPSVLDEHTQFVDTAGNPLNGGFAYFGDQNADPVLNPVSIFSDRDLTVVLANPQTLDSLGRTTNKVWLAGPYSLKIEDLNNVQIYQELDNGESPAAGVTVLENVSGGNTITATAASTITAYQDNELYAFRTVSVNTTGITLNIDSVDAKSVLKNHDQAILPDDFEADQNVIVSYNATDDVFEWVNQNVKTVTFYEGTPVVSAATADIWATDGNNLHLTGATGPITSLGTAPNVGAVRWVTIDSTPTFTQSANLNLPGGVDFTAAAGDVARVYADTTTQLDVTIFPASGKSPVPPTAASQAEQEAATSNTVFATPANQQFHPSACKMWVFFNGTGTIAINDSYNVDSLTDVGTGTYGVNFTNDMASINYPIAGLSAQVSMIDDLAHAVGSVRVQTVSGAHSGSDADRVSVMAFGDLA